MGRSQKQSEKIKRHLRPYGPDKTAHFIAGKDLTGFS